MWTLMWFFGTNYIMFELKKSIGELYSMEPNIDATFDRKLTCSFKNKTRNSANFNGNTFENLKNWEFDEVLLFKIESV